MSAWEGSAFQEAHEREKKEAASKATSTREEKETAPRLPAASPAPTPSGRDNWDKYFIGIANAVASRGTCDRKKVGCVLVIGRSIVSTGYNGALSGLEHCDDVGHDLVETLDHLGRPKPNCVRTVHAEANAIALAARRGTALAGATAYVNTYPCWPCFRLLATAGIARVVYQDAYRNDPRVDAAALKLGIKLEHFT